MHFSAEYKEKKGNLISKIKNDEPKLSRKMGYISNVNDAKDILEKLYKLKESKG